MRVMFVAMLVLALAAAPALAENQGQAGFQCVTVKWDVAPTFPPQAKVEAWVFGRPVAVKTLTLEDKAMAFEYAEGYLEVKGAVSAEFTPYDGVGVLRLDSLDAACDFTGNFPVKPRKLADFTFEEKFDY